MQHAYAVDSLIETEKRSIASVDPGFPIDIAGHGSQFPRKGPSFGALALTRRH